MPSNIRIYQLDSAEVIALVNSSILISYEPIGDSTLRSKIMFMSTFTPVDVEEASFEQMINYTILFEGEPALVPSLWFVSFEGECTEEFELVSTSLYEPLEQGKRGGEIVVIRQPI